MTESINKREMEESDELRFIEIGCEHRWKSEIYLTSEADDLNDAHENIEFILSRQCSPQLSSNDYE
jgi:hypothetical protein